MKPTLRTFQLFAAMLLAAMVAATLPLPALADDELPPVPTEELIAPVENSGVTMDGSAEEGSPTEEADPTEEVPPIEESFEVDPPIESEQVAETDLVEPVLEATGVSISAPEVPALDDSVVNNVSALIAELPESAELIVLDEQGEALPLASEAAAEVIAGGDPMWCPAGVVPQEFVGGCSQSYTSLQALLSWLELSQPTVAGVIWLQAGWDSGVYDSLGQDFRLDGDTDFFYTSDYSLTIKGGWNGPGLTTVDENNPSVIQGQLWITWYNNVTISDIILKNIDNEDALIVEAVNGNINLTRVQVINNQNNGAVLDNGWDLPKSVTVKDSVFANNGDETDEDGLDIFSFGTVTISHIVADLNAGYGAWIDNCHYDSATYSCTGHSPVTIAGTNEFNYNGGGLNIYSGGTVTINNLTASNNSDFEGVWLENWYSTNSTRPGIILTGTNRINENGTDGLVILTEGPAKINNLTANDNGWGPDPGGDGVYIDNSYAPGPAGVTISLSGGYPRNEFMDNNGFGIRVYTHGLITMNSIVSDGNAAGGLLGWDDPDIDSSPSGIIVNGSGASFSNNYFDGIEVHSSGPISFTHLYASDNGGYGALIITERNVSISGASEFNGNSGGNGLEINSVGTVTLNSVEASYNFGEGAHIDSSWDPWHLYNVSLTGAFHHFNFNGGNGLTIATGGAITVNNLSANYNGQDSPGGYGALLDNCFWGTGGSPSGGGDCLSITPKSIVVSGYANFIGNLEGTEIWGTSGNGLLAYSLGSISLNNVNADDNERYGAFLANDFTGGVAGITINNTSTYWPSFSGNGNSGLEVWSWGAVKIKDLDAEGNGWYGAYVSTNGSATLGSSRANWCNSFSENGNAGLVFGGGKAVTVYNLCNSNNGADGAWISSWGSGGSITLNGHNSFINNHEDGLYVEGDGAIIVNNVTAYDNGMDCSADPCVPLSSYYGFGVHLQNWVLAGITIKGYAYVENNAQTGLYVHTFGSISLANITANDNGQYNWWADVQVPVLPANDNGWGAYVDNCGFDNDIDDCVNTVTGKGITLTGINTFNGNYQDGLWATSLGPIKANMLSANDNGGASTFNPYEDFFAGIGAYLDNNWDQSAVVGVTVTTNTIYDANIFTGNKQQGIAIFSEGPITLTNIIANDNWDGGATFYTSHATPQSIIMYGWNMFNNNHNDDGLEAWANGNITLNNVTANSNLDGVGADIDNCFWDGSFCTGIGSIILNGINTFSDNGTDGLLASSHGNISIKNISAHNNGGRGIVAGADGNILISCASLVTNFSFGWELQAWGTVTLKGVVIFGNNGPGSADDTQLNNGTLIQTRSC